MSTKYVKTCLLILTCCCAASPVRSQSPIEQKLAAAADGSVEIYNLSGSIRIVGWQRDEVEVTGTLGKGVDKLTFERQGKRIVLRTEIPKNARNVGESDLRLRLPHKSSVAASSISASIEVAKTKGILELETVSGKITVADDPSEIEARSVSGNIEIDATATQVTSKSISGDLKLKLGSGDMRGETVSGRIDIAMEQLARGDFKSVSGNIKFAGELQKQSRLEVNNHSGNIRLLLPAKTSADFRLGTFSGSIDNALGPAARQASDYVPEKKLGFSTGSGGARVIARTFSGNLSIEKK